MDTEDRIPIPHQIITGNRRLTITKNKNSVDIWITKYGYTNKEIEDTKITISIDDYYSLLNKIAAVG